MVGNSFHHDASEEVKFSMLGANHPHFIAHLLITICTASSSNSTFPRVSFHQEDQGFIATFLTKTLGS